MEIMCQRAAHKERVYLSGGIQVMARSVRRGRPWMARQTWAGVSGMSACRTP